MLQPKKKGNVTTVTRQDSIALYNNTLEKEKFYKNNKDYIENKARINFKDSKVVNYLINTIKKEKSLPDGTDFGNGESILYKKDYKNRTKQINSNLYSAADFAEKGADSYYNPKAPAILISNKINAQGSKSYYSSKFGDTSEMPYYDKLAVKPFDLLTDKQKVQRVKQYGRDGVPDSYGKQTSIIKKEQTVKDRNKPNKPIIVNGKKDYPPTNNNYDNPSNNQQVLQDRKLEIFHNPIYPLEPAGIKTTNNSLETSTLNIKPEAKVPKSYNVTDYIEGSTSYNGSQSSYQVSDLSKLSEQSPNNKRTIVPRYEHGGKINTNTNDMKYVKRPVKKLGIGGLLSAGSGLVGTVNPIAGIGLGAAGSIISGLEEQDAAQEAKNAMLVQMLKDKKVQDAQDNVGYKVNGNNDYSYYAEGGEISQQEDPKSKRAALELIAKANRAEIVRKKDSIINRNLNATGLDRVQYRAKLASDAKKSDVGLDGMQTTDANKRTAKNGSCTTGATMGGDSLKDVKAYGGNLQSSSTGKFDTTGGKLIPLSNNAELAVGNTHNSKQIDGEYGITLDKGGEPIAEVENKEVITNGQRVFSDRLMFDKNNTFADKIGKIATMSGKIEAKLSKTKDTKSINGYKRMLAGNKMQEDALFKQQEEAQEVEGSDKMAYGGSIPKYANGNNDFLKSLLELNQDGFSRSSNKGQIAPTKVDTTSYLNEAVKAPISVTEGKDITSEDPNTPKSFKDYLTPNLIDNAVNGILTATTPKLAAPMRNVAQRLKTTYDVNPELATVSREINAVAQNVMQNTADSNDARANIASARLQGAIQKGLILSQKQNIETQLINQDKGNRQNVDASNTALANKYMGDKFNRANDIQTRISGNFANLSEDIKGSQTAVGMDKYYRQQLILDLQNDITGSKARAYKNNPKLMADPEIAAMVNATFQSRKLN